MPWTVWVGFVGAVVVLLFADLLILHKRPHTIHVREATLESLLWIGLGVGFGGVVHATMGLAAAQDYLAGYLVEKSLSVDNLFVFLLVFAYFRVPPPYQHRLLFYGIFGALVFRGVFIALGTVLLQRFSWVAFVFGGFLLWSGWHLAFRGQAEVHPEANPVLRWIRRHVPMTPDYVGTHLTVRDEEGRWRATPLLAVLVVIETTDIVFAVDSIPAVFGITRDPFLVFSSNAMALLGMRALYFLLADVMVRFRYLHYGLAVVLGVIGLKLVYEELVHQVEKGQADWVPTELVTHLPHWFSLALVAGILAITIAASLVGPRRAAP